MILNTKNLVSMTEVNQNFSQIAKNIDNAGAVVVLKNNKPRYLITKIDDTFLDLTENETIEVIAKRILNEHKTAFEVLAND